MSISAERNYAENFADHLRQSGRFTRVRVISKSVPGSNVRAYAVDTRKTKQEVRYALPTDGTICSMDAGDRAKAALAKKPKKGVIEA